MAEQTYSVNIRVNTETGQLEVLGAKLKDAGVAGGHAKDSFLGLSGAARELLGPLAQLGTVAGLVSFLKSSIQAANEDAEALRRLQFAVEANGGSWTKMRQPIIDWAEGLQLTTRFSNSEALNALQRLSSATTDVGQAQQAVRVAMGISVEKAIPLNQAVEIMNGLMVGNERAVKQAHRELGTFTDGATTAQGTLNALNKHFAESAQKEQSFSKDTNTLKNAWDDFQKLVGNALIPAFAEIIKWLTTGIMGVQNAITVIAGMAAKFVILVMETGETIKSIVTGICSDIGSLATGLFKSVIAMAQGHMLEAQEIIAGTASTIVSRTKQMYAQIQAQDKDQQLKFDIINDEVAKSFIMNEDKKTAAVKAAANTGTQIKAQAAAVDAAKAAEQALKFLTIQTDLQKKIEALGEETFAKKIETARLDYELEHAKIVKEITDHEEQIKLFKLLDKEYDLTKQDLAQKQAQRNTALAFQTADTAVKTLITLNEMGDKGSQAEKTRAIALMALQQAIAIGWIWVGVANGIGKATIWSAPAAVALGAAQTAMLLAQFASQVQAIQRTSTGGGTTLNLGLSGGSSTLNGGESTGPFGDVVSFPGSSSTTSGTATTTARTSGVIIGSSPQGSGSGQTINVNIPVININVAVDTLESADRRRLLQALGDELRTQTVEAIRFSVTSANLASNNSQVAV